MVLLDLHPQSADPKLLSAVASGVNPAGSKLFSYSVATTVMAVLMVAAVIAVVVAAVVVTAAARRQLLNPHRSLT